MWNEARFTTCAATWAILVSAMSAAKADVVYSQSTIVIGNGCVGYDCGISGIPDADPTLTLEENNTRIQFLDGSSNFSLVANSSSNGADSYFAISSPGTINFSSASLTADTYRTYMGSVQPDGRLQVGLDPSFANVTVSHGETTVTDGDVTVETTAETYFYLPAGTYEPFFPGTYRTTANTAVETDAGQPMLVSGAVTGAVPLILFSDDGSSIALGKGSANAAASLSVGSVGVERNLANVAPGTQATDLINLAQLEAALTPLPTQQAVAIDALHNDVKGISAISTALSALQENPRRYSKTTYSLGLAFYDEEIAAAIGVTVPVNDTALYSLAVVGSTATSPQVSLQGSIRW